MALVGAGGGVPAGGAEGPARLRAARARCRSTTSASSRPCSSRHADGARLLITKGAPEAVLARCADVPAAQRAPCSSGLFADGARVVAVADPRRVRRRRAAVGDERELQLAGFLTFVDRPKADAGAAIAELARLGIAVKIITGDNGIVAAKVCRDIGLDGATAS